jgi:hypothetical protein
MRFVFVTCFVFLSKPNGLPLKRAVLIPRRRESRPADRYGIRARSACKTRKPLGIGDDFFQAVIDETSGACRSSEEP